MICLIEDGFPDLSPIHDDWSSGYLAKKDLTHGEEISCGLRQNTMTVVFDGWESFRKKVFSAWDDGQRQRDSA